MVTSIALGLIGNYCTIPGVSVNGALVSNMTSVYDPGQIDYYGNSGPAFFTDVMSVFAVEYAQSIGILPGVKIKLRRFTDCGQYEPLLDQSYSGSPSGFALSILAQDIVETYPDVIGVIGTEYSSTAKGVAEVLSNNKITYCSTASGAPSLSDKKKYPYFWRVVPSAGTGEHFYQLLSSFNVTRVAVVYQSNSELGRGFASDFLQSMMAHGITVIAYMPVSLEASQEMIEYVGKSLDASSVKYIFLSGSGSFLGKILDGLGRANFFSQDKVWLVANLVSTPSPDTVLVANKTGIILMYPKGFPNTSLQKTVMSQFLEKYPAATDPEFVYLYQTFDCVMLMLLGLQNLVRSNSSFTIDMLAKRQLQEHINFTLFQNLGYSGLVNSPVELTDNGDLASPWAAYYYTGDYLNITAFGQTNNNATVFTYRNDSKPIFYGGSSVAPPDGRQAVPNQLQHSMQNRYGAVLVALTASGVFMIIICLKLVLWFRKTPIYCLESFATLLGYFLLYAMIPMSLYTSSGFSCRLRSIHWEHFNESTSMIAIIAVIGITYCLVQNELSYTTHESDFKIGVCIWIAVTVVLLGTFGLKLTKLIKISRRGDTTILQRNSFMEDGLSKSHRKSLKKSRASSLGRELDQFSYHHKILNQTQDFCIYQFKRGKYGRWSMWFVGQPELHILKGRIWVSLYSPKQIPCFCLLSSTRRVVTDNVLFLSMGSDMHRKESTNSTIKAQSKDQDVQYELTMEFESFDKASAFLAELTATIDQFGVPRPSRVLESKLHIDIRRQSES